MDLSVDLPQVHDDGRFISAKVSRIVELIREYDHRLDVKWVPPDRRAPDDPAFAITERLGDGREVVAFYVDNEESFNENVLTRIYMGDNTKHDVQARITAQNAAVTRVSQLRAREENQQFAEFIGSMIRSHKSYYRHGGKTYHL